MTILASSKMFNMYDDRQGAHFHDLSDMGIFHANLEREIKNDVITYDNSMTHPDYYVACRMGLYEHRFDSITLFQLNDRNDVVSLVSFARSFEINANQEQVYSVGYSVSKNYRKKGIGAAAVRQGIEEIRAFLNEYGIHYKIGPCDDFRYILETVVSTDNEASNKIASKYLQSFEEVTEGEETRSKKWSKVYRYLL